MDITEEYARTDLACEWGTQKGCAGATLRRGTWGHGEIQRLVIETEGASGVMGRPRGEYVTVTCGKIWTLSSEVTEDLEETVAKVLLKLLGRELGGEVGRDRSLLVVGLGNREITADALGPRTVDQLIVTRHLREREPGIFRRMDCAGVSALCPGVLGQTGMEAAEVLGGAISRFAVDAVVAVDALAARSTERLAATVQISTAGIEPGSGIGNDRTAICRETVGVPVIALGIPTVVDSSTLVWDVLRRAGIEKADENLHRILENGRRFFVSPKEADLITVRTSALLAHAINRAFVGVPFLA